MLAAALYFASYRIMDAWLTCALPDAMYVMWLVLGFCFFAYGRTLAARRGLAGMLQSRFLDQAARGVVLRRRGPVRVVPEPVKPACQFAAPLVFAGGNRARRPGGLLRPGAVAGRELHLSHAHRTGQLGTELVVVRPADGVRARRLPAVRESAQRLLSAPGGASPAPRRTAAGVVCDLCPRWPPR